jgi:hypothetical protein
MKDLMISTQQTDRCNQNEQSEAVRLRNIERFHLVVRREIMTAAPSEFAHETGMGKVFCDDGLGLALKNVSSASFNRWAGIGVNMPATEPAVDRAIEWMTEHANSNWGLELPPAAVPVGLVDWIEARGLRVSPQRSAVFWRDAVQATNAPETEFVIRRAGVEDADVFGATAVSSFGMPESFKAWMSAFPGRPRWHAYIAYRDRTPAGVAAMFIEADMAWFGIDATLPAFRQRGVQGTLLSRRIRDATQYGVKLLTIETDLPNGNELPNASYRNIQRAGFILSHSRPHYVKSSEAEIIVPPE